MFAQPLGNFEITQNRSRARLIPKDFISWNSSMLPQRKSQKIYKKIAKYTYKIYFDLRDTRLPPWYIAVPVSLLE